MTQPQKNIIITYPIPDSSVIHSSTSISANLIMGAKNKFRIDNPMVQEKFITRNLWKIPKTIKTKGYIMEERKRYTAKEMAAAAVLEVIRGFGTATNIGILNSLYKDGEKK